MTEQRKLKGRIRERSDRTGETYTTARRHVLGKGGQRSVAAAPLPDGIVPGYPGFSTAAHHDSALLAHLLAQAGVTAPHTGEPYSEAMLAGLAGGIGFMYALFEYQGWQPMLTVVAQHHPQPWLPTALDHLGLPHTEQHSSKVTIAMTRLFAVLDGGRAVHCLVDRTGLAWHAGRPGIHTDPYGVVVAGRDGGTLWLDDGGPAPRPMSEEDFAAAWSGYAKGRHHMRVIGDAAPVIVDLTEAVRTATRMTVAHLTGPVLGHSFDVNFGFSGMARLADQVRDDRGKTGWARRFGTPELFALAMRRLHDCLEREHTAPGATRPLYAEFLDEAAPVLGGAAAVALREAANLFRESGALWARLASTAAEVSFPPDEEGRRSFLAELAGLVDAARRIEERAAAVLTALSTPRSTPR